MRRDSTRTSWLRLALAAASIATGSAAPIASAYATPLELGIAFGYHQGFGPVGAGMPNLQDLGAAGGALDVDLGWRFDRRWLAGAYAEVAIQEGTDASPHGQQTGFAAGIQGQFHLRPGERYDPWLGLGFGWRGIWVDRGSGAHDQAVQGLDLARLRIGLDFRVSDTVGMGPVFGVTLTEFFSEKSPNAGGYSDISDRKLSTFVYAGVGGRFGL